MHIMNDEYYIGDIRVNDLCDRFGTPLYVYDLSVIKDRIDQLRKKIGDINSDTKFLYSVKANYNPFIVKFIVEQGLGIDAVSIEEVKLGLHCGAKTEDMLYTECNMTDSEMDEARKLGILINVGSLSRLEKFGEKYPREAVCVRFNPNVGAASHISNITGGPDSKFGIPFEFFDNVLSIVNKYHLNLVGIHEHVGSGWLGLKEPLIAVDVMLQMAQKIPGLDFVDFGGGFGVPYEPNQKKLDLESFGKELKSKITEFQRNCGKNLKLLFEPGRYIVAEAGHLLTRVTSLKTLPDGRVLAGVDSGMNQLVRVAMYDSYHPVTNTSNPRGVEKIYDVCGNICENTDFFAKSRVLKEVHEGDLLSIDISGAYGMSMASNYQFRPLPAEIMVDGNEITEIRPRQTFEDLLRQF